MEYHMSPRMEAIEKIENFIVVNRLTANTRIPSERDLCEMWGVSRSTLRQAVDTLVSWGMLYRVRSSGVYVSVPKKNRNMLGVESMIGELRQQGMFLSKKIISSRVVEATKQISKKLKIPLGTKVYEYIRVRNVDYVPSIIETTYIDCKRYPDFNTYYNEKNSMDYIFRSIYHKKQEAGEEHISVTYASAEEARILEIDQGAPLFFTSGMIEDEEGIPMTYYKQLFRSDQFKFVSLVNKE